MGKFIIVRHGESEANRDGVFAASADVPLTETGRKQALESAARIAKAFKPVRLISSAFLRARQSAEIIAAQLNLPVEIVEGIQERNLGVLKGQPFGKNLEVALQDRKYDPARNWLWRPSGGESYDDVRQRVLPAFESLRDRYPDEELIIVSHGAVMRSLWFHFTQSWDKTRIVPNCGVMLIEHDSGQFLAPRIIED